MGTDKPERVSGVWDLRADGSNVVAVVRAIEACLLGQHMLHVELDTWQDPTQMKPAWEGMRERVEVFTPIGAKLGTRIIYIPVSGGVRIPVEPLDFGGNQFASMVEINGDHVVVRVPYLFGTEPTHVLYRHHSFSRVEAIE